MRIEVIERSDRGRRKGLLQAAFALRHRVFVEDHGWQFLRRPDGLDIDQHDTGAATHILAMDGDAVVGHIRVIPGGYLVVSRADPARLREAAGDALLYGPSRLCVDPATSFREAVLIRLVIAAFDQAVARGAGAFLFDTNPGMIFVLRVLGLTLTPVGEPVPAGDRSMQPVVVRFEPWIVATLRRNFSAVEARPDVVGTRLLRELRATG
jgi:acyl-homoserine lactone synthase